MYRYITICIFKIFFRILRKKSEITLMKIMRAFDLLTIYAEIFFFFLSGGQKL